MRLLDASRLTTHETPSAYGGHVGAGEGVAGGAERGGVHAQPDAQFYPAGPWTGGSCRRGKKQWWPVLLCCGTHRTEQVCVFITWLTVIRSLTSLNY